MSREKGRKGRGGRFFAFCLGVIEGEKRSKAVERRNHKKGIRMVFPGRRRVFGEGSFRIFLGGRRLKNKLGGGREFELHPSENSKKKNKNRRHTSLWGKKTIR